MARIRSIKPEFWTSAQVMECSPMARLLFIGMWNFADDAGRMAYSPKTLKAQIYPSDEVKSDDIKRMVDELSSNDLLLIYVIDGKEFISITGWKHQKIDKPRSSNIPGPFDECSTIDRRKVATDPILSDPKGSEGNGSDPKETRVTALADGWPADWRDRFWSTYPNKVGKPKALAKLEACMRRGIDFADVMAGLDRYIRTKPADRAWLNPETFINQERWTDQPATIQGHRNGKAQSDNSRAGSLIGAIDRRLAELALEEQSDPALPADNLLRIPNRPV